MANPDLSLKPGEMLVRLVTSAASGMIGKGIQSGAVLVTYDNQMGYNVGDSVSFFNEKLKAFTYMNVYNVYGLINQNDVFFKINTPL